MKEKKEIRFDQLKEGENFTLTEDGRVFKKIPLRIITFLYPDGESIQRRINCESTVGKSRRYEMHISDSCLVWKFKE